MKKIMFICTGNICRSAMAEKMMAKKIKEQNKDIQVYSSGIYAEDGDISTENAVDIMKERGIDLTQHRATNIANSKIKEMDLILCATVSHKYNVIQMYPELKEKVFTIKEYVDGPSKDMDIKDPWGYDIVIYRNCAQELENYIDKIIEKL